VIPNTTSTSPFACSAAVVRAGASAVAVDAMLHLLTTSVKTEG
jgi:hypothetical protein